MKPRILLVEDEKNLLEAIRFNLEMEDYEVEPALNGLQALKKFKEQRFNLVILDVMIPEMDGFAVCEKIRLDNMDIPILFLTAKDAHADKIKGFRLGADDYVTKPFNLEEVLMRVQVLVKHSMKGTKDEVTFKSYKFGDNEINFATYEAKGVNGIVKLTKKEAQLLKLLIDHRNQAVSRQQILQYVWEYDIFPSTRTIDNFILSFRKYFEKDLRNPRYFHSIRGVGYKFTD
ncbi:MAG TPA: response regulator transcription factor [Chitinophagales bacterium]|nr:response regulator transcription factor [Chitinophagales bacterium]